MSNNLLLTPLLADDSPLDAHSREVVAALHTREAEAALSLPTDDPLDPKRRMRVDLTKPEMWNQPEMIRHTLAHEADAIRAVARDIASRSISRVYMAGCGDSLAVMIALRLLFERAIGVPCEPVQSLDFAYYNHASVGPGTLLLALSSSGTTTRTVEALLLAKALGASVVAVTNTLGSPLSAEAHSTLRVHAERKGWPTQASTAAMAALTCFALELAGALGRSAEVAHLVSCFDVVPDLMQQTLLQHDAAIAALADREAGRSVYLYAGGGPSFASALFGAAKVKECSPDHAIAIQLEEFHHYNSQKRGDPLFLIAPQGPSVPRSLDTAKEGKRWGGSVYSIATEGDRTLAEVSDSLFLVPRIAEELSVFVTAVPVQLFAYHVAMAKFRNAEREAAQ